ncbi:MAG: zinc-binding dehydrogenase, partial [Clostridiales bacterium]|nr:zinc-binding dehydrogenase [Clostridiales bacterium]
GCGTIGIFTLQWAKIFGAKRIVAFDINDDRLALAKRMGADEVINTLSPDFMEQTQGITGGVGFENVFESAGTPATMKLAFELAANKAKVCFIGTPHKDVTFTPKQWENLNRKEFSLVGSWMSYSAPFPGKEWALTAHYFATGELKFDKDFIFRTFPMEQVSDAFSLYRNPDQVHGKILLINDK